MSARAQRLVDAARDAPFRSHCGRVVACNGLVLEARGPRSALGDLCSVEVNGRGALDAQVIGFRDDRVLLMPFGDAQGVSVGAVVRAGGGQRDVAVGEALLGRVVDALGQPIDGLGPIEHTAQVPLHHAPIQPLERAEVTEVLETGVRSIDTLVTLGRGQRVGIFAGSGVGKSTLLGMLTRQAKADVIVVAMVGERGREVGDFIAESLGEEGLARAVVIAATADQPPLLRIHAVHAAHATAEYFRDQGLDVLLVVDSMTRFAMAQREIGIAAGEPPASRGYPPSVFTWLPRIFERCGRLRRGGSITAVYTVLVEGDDMNEPVADHMRAILDGHIVLARGLADRGQLPAIDVLRSVSRLMGRLATPEERELATRTRALLAAYERSRDLIGMGAYQSGHDPVLDDAVRVLPELERLLRQNPDDRSSRKQALAALVTVVGATEVGA
ncbi:FliI/YscN family ATPase [Fulvimonas yonginensis]|uniref:Flagellum-specific ATP synthase n=1 Tax=Fulvimonas yonginensis TaxID=1495200 RepID=A0ABU8JDY3_9GAMM